MKSSSGPAPKSPTSSAVVARSAMRPRRRHARWGSLAHASSTSPWAHQLRWRRLHARAVRSSRSLTRIPLGPDNTGDKLRSGARVRAADRRGHEAACPFWQPCRRKLRQLHPLVRPPRGSIARTVATKALSAPNRVLKTTLPGQPARVQTNQASTNMVRRVTKRTCHELRGSNGPKRLPRILVPLPYRPQPQINPTTRPVRTEKTARTSRASPPGIQRQRAAATAMPPSNGK